MTKNIVAYHEKFHVDAHNVDVLCCFHKKIEIKQWNIKVPLWLSLQIRHFKLGDKWWKKFDNKLKWIITDLKKKEDYSSNGMTL